MAVLIALVYDDAFNNLWRASCGFQAFSAGLMALKIWAWAAFVC